MKHYQRSLSGRHEFTFEWKVNGAMIAEFDCACDYEITFGHEPDRDDPGSGDEITITHYWVEGLTKNPLWVGGGDNAGIKFYNRELQVMPKEIEAIVVAEIEKGRVLEDISEEARLIRGREHAA